jgi:hypothetical protein
MGISWAIRSAFWYGDMGMIDAICLNRHGVSPYQLGLSKCRMMRVTTSCDVTWLLVVHAWGKHPMVCGLDCGYI